jgi:2-C-methyl-D-erythritol 4-phosphate cytidylyltransferase
MRSQISAVQTPAGFTFSETQAEQLGPNQYAFIDTSDKQEKTRIYVTVRRGYAILFTLNFTADGDLATLREILATATFTK